MVRMNAIKRWWWWRQRRSFIQHASKTYDFEKRIRNEISAEEYVRRLDGRVKQRTKDYKER